MRTFRQFGTALLAVALLLTLLLPGEAAVIVLKDGFILKGKSKRGGETIFDPASGQQIPIANGFWFMDDGPRRIIFSSRQILQDDRAVDKRDPNDSPDLVQLQRVFVSLNQLKLEAIGAIEDVSPFDGDGSRTFKFQPKVGAVLAADQKLNFMTPHYVRIDAVKYRWSAFCLTQEFRPETVRDMLRTFPEMREKAGKVDPLKRMRRVRFFKQCGWYEEAEAELDRFLEDAPGQKAAIEEARRAVLALKAEQLLADLELGYLSGRHDWVRKRLADFPRGDLDQKQLNQLAVLKSKYQAAEDALAPARQYLHDLPGHTAAADRKTWEQAAETILAELNLDNASRLERFVTFAKQAERQRKMKMSPTQGPEKLLALAVSGWLLGNAGAEDSPTNGLKLWRTRQFVAEYQRTADDGDRRRLLKAYEKAGAVPFDVLAGVLATLPPPEPETKLPEGMVEQETKEPWGPRKGGVPYLLQLPPEYQHSRSYPVLVVLHHTTETPKIMMERFAELAEKHGYILAAPDWGEGGLRQTYAYSADEHAAVLDVLRDLRRRFNVDTDRVFMAGFGQGASMAFDVGLAHPDLFAGVMPMGSPPLYFVQKYWPNAQNLPLYIVAGDLQAGDCAKTIRKPFLEHLVSRGYPTLYLEYKGRGMEWFGGELPSFFDWMSRKKRPLAYPEMGECQTMRATDNRFYWLSGEGIADRALNDLRGFNHQAIPASLGARVVEGNQIHVKSRGFKKVTLWLGPGMVDLEQPLSIMVNLQSRVKDRTFKPSLTTLLEDFHQRGDRRRLFLVKIELPI